MQVPFVDLSRQLVPIRQKIQESIDYIINEASFINGPAVSKFEELFATYLGVKNCIGCGNGTDAIEITLEALNIGPGDEVIVPAHTWLSSASAINSVGATPVFVNCNNSDFNLNPKEAQSKITTNTKAIIGVHLYGHPFDFSLVSIAKQSGIYLVEDCAQAHGATINGKKVGSFGDVATFSFYPSKNLGCFGDGGCIVTNDTTLASKIRAIHNCGQVKKNEHIYYGRNSRLDSLQAVILSTKLPYLEDWNNERIEAAGWYEEYLNNSSVVLPIKKDGYRHVYHIYSIRTKEKVALKKYLYLAGIKTGEHYPKLLPELAIYNSKEDFRKSHYIHELISLPMFPGIRKDEIEYVSDKIIEFENNQH